MNKFVSEAFGEIIGFLHILFVVGIIVILYVGNNIYNGDLTYPIIFSIIISIIYILSIGLISTVININNTLIKIEKKIGNTNNSSENENPNFYHKNNVSSHNQKELNVNKTVKNEYLKTIDPERKLESVWLNDNYGQHVYLFGADNFIHYDVTNNISCNLGILLSDFNSISHFSNSELQDFTVLQFTLHYNIQK